MSWLFFKTFKSHIKNYAIKKVHLFLLFSTMSVMTIFWRESYGQVCGTATCLAKTSSLVKQGFPLVSWLIRDTPSRPPRQSGLLFLKRYGWGLGISKSSSMLVMVTCNLTEFNESVHNDSNFILLQFDDSSLTPPLSELILALKYVTPDKVKRKGKKAVDKGELHVHLLEAKNLPGKDADGMSDPFCKWSVYRVFDTYSLIGT